MNLIDKDKTMEEIPIDVCDGFEVTDIIEKIPTVKAISLDKVKQAREEIENEIKFWNEETTDSNSYTTEIRKAKANSYKHCLELLDKLIESEV